LSLDMCMSLRRPCISLLNQTSLSNAPFYLFPNLSPQLGCELLSFILVQILSLASTEHGPTLVLEFRNACRSWNDVEVYMGNHLRRSNTCIFVQLLAWAYLPNAKGLTVVLNDIVVRSTCELNHRPCQNRQPKSYKANISSSICGVPTKPRPSSLYIVHHQAANGNSKCQDGEK
jgi:hypothetical protein